MREKINEKVSIVSYYSDKKNRFLPLRLIWKNREYQLGELGMVHPYKIGDTWHHIFEMVDNDQSMSFRLNFNTKELSWTLEVVSDGLPT
jgi:hypothetical protein